MPFNSYIVFLQIAVTQNQVSVIRLSYKILNILQKVILQLLDFFTMIKPALSQKK